MVSSYIWYKMVQGEINSPCSPQHDIFFQWLLQCPYGLLLIVDLYGPGMLDLFNYFVNYSCLKQYIHFLNNNKTFSGNIESSQFWVDGCRSPHQKVLFTQIPPIMHLLRASNQ